MIYKIKLSLKDIETGNDPWELHFSVSNEDKNICHRLKKDFIFRMDMDNDWIVSANRTTFRGQSYWYIKGSNNHKDGNKKYFKLIERTSYFKRRFNKELLEKYPEIREDQQEGLFDSKEGIMRVK